MILEYSYDKANQIVSDFEKSKIASLTILKEADNCVMEYTLVENLTDLQQAIATKTLSESLMERLQVVNILNKFIEAQIHNGVNNFALQFNVVDVKKCEINYSYSFQSPVEDNKSLFLKLEDCLEEFDLLITKLGIGDVELDNTYTKVSSRKYGKITMKDFGDAIRKELNND